MKKQKCSLLVLLVMMLLTLEANSQVATGTTSMLREIMVTEPIEVRETAAISSIETLTLTTTEKGSVFHYVREGMPTSTEISLQESFDVLDFAISEREICFCGVYGGKLGFMAKASLTDFIGGATEFDWWIIENASVVSKVVYYEYQGEDYYASLGTTIGCSNQQTMLIQLLPTGDYNVVLQPVTQIFQDICITKNNIVIAGYSDMQDEQSLDYGIILKPFDKGDISLQNTYIRNILRYNSNIYTYRILNMQAEVKIIQMYDDVVAVSAGIRELSVNPFTFLGVIVYDIPNQQILNRQKVSTDNAKYEPLSMFYSEDTKKLYILSKAIVQSVPQIYLDYIFEFDPNIYTNYNAFTWFDIDKNPYYKSMVNYKKEYFMAAGLNPDRKSIRLWDKHFVVPYSACEVAIQESVYMFLLLNFTNQQPYLTNSYKQYVNTSRTIYEENPMQIICEQ